MPAGLLRRGSIHPAAEAAEAFLASAVLFLLIAAASPARHQSVLVVVLAGLYVYVVFLLARRLGPSYGVPLAIAGGVAFDWFYIPPTHSFGSESWTNWLAILIYISMGVLVGMLAARFRHRAAKSEQTRDVLQDEQAALRRVATLVARGAPSEKLFAAVVEEVARVLPADIAGLARYEPDRTCTVVAVRGQGRSDLEVRVGRRLKLGGQNINTIVYETGRPARIDSYADSSGALAALADEYGVDSGVGTPVIVEDDVWGVMSAYSTRGEPLPADTEVRLASFTELVATAISNTEARTQVSQLADEQAALRRVATLVAEGVAPPDVFAAVAREVGQLLDVGATHIGRYDADGRVTAISSWSREGPPMPPGTSAPLDASSVSGLVFTTGRPARKDHYDDASNHIAAVARKHGIRSSVAAPILVEGRLWGVMIASSNEDEPLPLGTESRIAAFTDLVATAVSNTDARTVIVRLADEQAALRRVATLVARGVPPSQLFDAVTAEVGRLLGTDLAGMIRYEPDNTVKPVAAWRAEGEHPPLPERWPIEDGDAAALIADAGGATRVADWSEVKGPIAAFIRGMGIRSSVASPILVEGRMWGALAVHTSGTQPLPATAESRLENFTELIATAISNAEARSDLAASRARVVAAADEERRRVVRDLHDGAQQRLVHTVVTLKLALRALRKNEDTAPALVNDALGQAESAMVELRELAHGILPSVLNRGGLRAGVEALASRMLVPVEIGVGEDRFPSTVEATAYFVVAEALTNVAKHADAGHATVVTDVDDKTLRIEIADDGAGTADPNGHGLLGLADRLASNEGELQVLSAPGSGTRVIATVPLGR
jgi:signal transduction histidine kinase